MTQGSGNLGKITDFAAKIFDFGLKKVIFDFLRFKRRDPFYRGDFWPLFVKSGVFSLFWRKKGVASQRCSILCHF